MGGHETAKIGARSNDEDFLMFRQLLCRFSSITFCAILLMAMTSPGSKKVPVTRGPDQFNGIWAMQIGDRTLALLTIANCCGSLQKVQVNLTRPSYVRFLAADTVADVTMPAKTQAFQAEKLSGTTLTIKASSGSEVEILTFSLAGGNSAELKFDGAPFGPLRFVRAGRQASISTDWKAGETYRASDSASTDNSELRALFLEDQAARGVDAEGQSDPRAQVLDLRKGDRERRNRAGILLQGGQVVTAMDYYRAAFIFQHGETSNDFLLAHHLALVSIAKGNVGASWIAAATLDRYLHSIGQPQVYGTQFRFPSDTRGIENSYRVTQDPFNQTLLSDQERNNLFVPSLRDQQERRKELEQDPTR